MTLARMLLCAVVGVMLGVPLRGAEPRSTISLSKAIRSQTALQVWLVYAGARALWIDGKYRKTHPGATQYSYTFEEEVDGRKAAALFWRILREKKPPGGERYFDDLVAVDDAKFMREYVWTFHRAKSWPTPAGLKLSAFEKWRA